MKVEYAATWELQPKRTRRESLVTEAREEDGGGNEYEAVQAPRQAPAGSVPIGRTSVLHQQDHSVLYHHHSANPKRPGGNGGQHPDARQAWYQAQYPPQIDSHVDLHPRARLSCRACPTFMSVPRPPFPFFFFFQWTLYIVPRALLHTSVLSYVRRASFYQLFALILQCECGLSRVRGGDAGMLWSFGVCD